LRIYLPFYQEPRASRKSRGIADSGIDWLIETNRRLQPDQISYKTLKMAPPQVPQITTQYPPAPETMTTTPIEMADTRSPWLSGRTELDRRWRESLSSSSSGPKTPVLGQGQTQEMGRIEAVLVGTPLTRESSNNQSSRHYATNPNSPVSPMDRSGMDFHSANTTPTLPPPAAAARRQSAMLEIRHSVQRLQNGQLETTVLPDVEAQPQVPGRKKWWWQKPRWKGVQNRLVTAVIAGIMCTIVLAICE
jgi:hypothetical protein